jgi:hypothetical protein
MGKYLKGTYRVMPAKTWGIRLVKKMTYPGVTIETFIETIYYPTQNNSS